MEAKGKHLNHTPCFDTVTVPSVTVPQISSESQDGHSAETLLISSPPEDSQGTYKLHGPRNVLLSQNSQSWGSFDRLPVTAPSRRSYPFSVGWT